MLMAQNEFQVTVLRKTADTFHSKHGITITTSYKFFLGGKNVHIHIFALLRQELKKGCTLTKTIQCCISFCRKPFQ